MIDEKTLDRWEREQRDSFDFSFWWTRLLMDSNIWKSFWVPQAIRGRAALCNNFGVMDTKDGALQSYNDKWFIRNQIFESIKQLVSSIIAEEVFIDVKGAWGDEEDDGMELLETEVNYAFSCPEVAVMERIVQNIYDQLACGYGAIREEWARGNINNYWFSGKPELRYCDPLRLVPDSAMIDPEWRDLRYVFECVQHDWDDFMRLHPEFKEKINSYQPNDVILPFSRPMGNMNRRVFEEWTCTYKVEYKVPSRMVTFEDLNEVHYIPDADYRENDPAIKRWLKEQGTVFISDEVIDYMFERWYQFKFMPMLNLVVQEPTDIGPHSGYSFYLGIRQPMEQGQSIPYPHGLVKYLLDLQDIDIVNTTTLVINTIKQRTIKPVMEENSLINQNEFLQGYGRLNGANPIVSQAWRSAQVGASGRDPYKFITAPIDVGLHTALHELTQDSIKKMSGATDAVRGTPEFSGQSGAMTSMMQAAAQVYNREDALKFRAFLRSIANNLMYQIAVYRGGLDVPHKILGVKDGEYQLLDVNTTNSNKLDSENYYCEISIENTPEAVRQMNQQMAIQLAQLGWISPVEAMNRLPGYENAAKLYNEALEFQMQQAMMQQQMMSQTQPQQPVTAEQTEQGPMSSNRAAGE